MHLAMEGDREPPSSPLFLSLSQKSSSFSSSPSSFPGIRTWVLVLLVSIFLILFIPTFFSSIYRFFRSSLVKSGWDALNLALVVFAIMCSLLGRDVASCGGGEEYRGEGEKMSVSSPRRLTQSQEWVAIRRSSVLEPSVYEANQSVGIRRMRSSSSYPNLRQEFHNDDDWGLTDSWRFTDDIQLYRPRPDFTECEISGDPVVKTIQVDTFDLTKSPSKSKPLPPKSFSPPPPPPPPPTQPNRRTVKKLPQTPPKTTPPLQSAIPPSPPPPPPTPVFRELKKKSHLKRSGDAAKDIASAIALFYNKKTRKSKTKKIHDDDLLASTSQSCPPPHPPPPPPPPPPSFVFSQLLSAKKGVSKNKRFNSNSDHRISLQPPLPPPPPPPPPPKKEPSFFSDQRLPPRKKREKVPNFMNAYPIAPPSPLPPLPPPPPLPPAFDEDDGDALSTDGAKASTFCPSPDVNNKADVFIKRFRDGLKLEKLNSIREKQRRRQNQPQEWQQEAGIEFEMEHQIMTMMMMGMDDSRN